MGVLTMHLNYVCLHLDDGTQSVSKVGPAAGTHFLRHEVHDLMTEAMALSFLGQPGLPVSTVILNDGGPKLFGSPFLLANSLPETRLSHMLPSLSRPERVDIDG